MPGSIPFAPLFVILGRGSDLRALRVHRSSRKAKNRIMGVSLLLDGYRFAYFDSACAPQFDGGTL